MMTLAFMIGMGALLFALGASGWVRSRTMGLVTTGAALAGLTAVAFLTVRVGTG